MTQILDKFKFPDENIWTCEDEDNPIPPYIFNDQIKIVLKVALVTERPLLITGNPGCGKTSLAKSIAAFQDWNYLKYTFTSRSRLEELTGEIDQLERLHDAQLKDPKALKDTWAYYKPGVFWWGFNAETALKRGGTPEQHEECKGFKEPELPAEFSPERKGTVILLDEIDKAEPDLPNDLLEPLDQLSFQLPGIDLITSTGLPPLVIITSNGERELPQAFLRRCITLNLPDPSTEILVNIAEHHFEKKDSEVDKLYSLLATKFESISEEAKDIDRRPPGTSEYLDAVKSCIELEISPPSEDANPEEDDNDEHIIWKQIEQATLRKAVAIEDEEA